MKITQTNVDDLTLTVTLNIGKEDYSEKKREILKKFRRDADIKGFRKGMAPVSLIEKMHGRSAVLDAVNSLISEGLNNYIEENKLNIIGEPLPSESVENTTDWDNDEEFSFSFDMALAPKFELNLSKEVKVPYYEVEISDAEREEYTSNLRKQFGALENVESVEEDDFIVADLVQEDNSIEGTYIALRSISNQEIKNQFIGKKANESFEIDVNLAFENETDRAAMLKVKKEELANINPLYTVVIKEVKRFTDAQEGAEFYARVFGEGVVNSKEEFDAKITERMAQEHTNESDYRFMLDAREALIERAAIALPEQFLKRWLYTANEGKFTMEEIEKDFDLFLKDFRWQLIRQSITREQNLTITRDNLLDYAKKIAGYQFAMYGLANAPEEQIAQYAESLLTNEKEGRRIYEKVEEEMVIDYVRSEITLDIQKTSAAKLRELTN